MTKWELLYEEMAKRGFTERSMSLAIGHSHGWLHIARKRNADLKMNDVEKMCTVLNLDVKRRYEIFLPTM